MNVQMFVLSYIVYYSFARLALQLSLDGVRRQRAVRDEWPTKLECWNDEGNTPSSRDGKERLMPKFHFKKTNDEL
ncbi:hypothetical protein OUZ56_016002 [Daphnia magna]|uniref:Uncharacterized protein n=1 Tax=Daphnia magna TaxID=35525 RepID=A0ABR0APG0_9CRUS|nr:hypothetical protein OUZ56_016002 [Daphnia magna]